MTIAEVADNLLEQQKHQDKQAAQLFGWLLSDIKALWDKEGFGSDDAVSEPLYARMRAAIQFCEKAGFRK